VNKKEGIWNSNNSTATVTKEQQVTYVKIVMIDRTLALELWPVLLGHVQLWFFGSSRRRKIATSNLTTCRSGHRIRNEQRHGLLLFVLSFFCPLSKNDSYKKSAALLSCGLSSPVGSLRHGKRVRKTCQCLCDIAYL
jgi:hypothetical protein